MSESKEIIKKYPKGDFNILWKPKKCIHSGICVKTLPDVYDPKGRPWITPENASVEALKKQIDSCPSGALGYEEAESPSGEAKSTKTTAIQVIPGGPLLVSGSITLEVEGEQTRRDTPSTALCRCGASSNKPYCDGAHKNVDFE